MVHRVCVFGMHTKLIGQTTPSIKNKAEKLNIQLLQVPKGMTEELQPLDFNINGPYKMKIRSHWIRNHFNKNEKDFHLNLCSTILTCFDDLKTDLIKDSFNCLN